MLLLLPLRVLGELARQGHGRWRRGELKGAVGAVEGDRGDGEAAGVETFFFFFFREREKVEVTENEESVRRTTT